MGKFWHHKCRNVLRWTDADKCKYCGKERPDEKVSDVQKDSSSDK